MSSDPIVLITGANTGLGYETVKALLESSQPYTILLGARDITKGESAITKLKTDVSKTTSTLHAVPVDVESDDSISALATDISSRFGRIDALVNNAGANFESSVNEGKLTRRQAWNKTWDVNVTGAVVMTEAFAGLLVKSVTTPRLIFIASGTSSMHETTLDTTEMFRRLNASPEAGWPKAQEFNPTFLYRSVKAGLNMAMRQWTRTLKNDGVKVFGVSPGFLATNLNGVGSETLKKMGAVEPSVGGHFVSDVIEGKRDDQAGLVIRKYAPQAW